MMITRTLETADKQCESESKSLINGSITKSSTYENGHLKLGSVPCLCSQRWILAYTGFFGVFFVYALRVNISMAMVCMVQTFSLNDTMTTLGNETEDMKCPDDNMNNPHLNEHAEFDWNKPLRSSMLASFFYGYIITQIPGGWLADRFGGKRVFGIAMAISGISNVLLPVCARLSYLSVFILRVITGLATGVTFPALQSIWGRWAPPLERSKLIAFSGIGRPFGNIGTFATSGILCEYGFDNGWGSIFYLSGGLTCLWVISWFILTSDSPVTHPRISQSEIDYIVSKIEYNTSERSETVPWMKIFTSPVVWACLTAHVCNNWTNYTLLTSLPAFMKEVLKFDIKENGVWSAIPYICQATSAIIAGYFADFLRTRKLLSTTSTRRLCQLTGFLGAGACLIVTGFTPCEHRYLAVAFLSLAVMFTGFSQAGYICNHVDFAPKYAGVIYGLTNMAGTVPGMVAPIVAGALTPNRSQEEWRTVFYVCAGFDVLGALVFGFFSSGELQTWARDIQEEIVGTVDDSKYDATVDNELRTEFRDTVM